MDNKDYLSQEEIDALLRQSLEEEPAELDAAALPPDVNDYLDSMEQDALGEIGNITFGSAATALSTLLGRKVDITTPRVDVLYYKELQALFPKPHVSVHVDYVEGFQGVNMLVIKEDDAKVIADLMLGGDGRSIAEAMNEIHLSAVQEAMNQMMGSSATSMSTIFNRFVNISPPGIELLDFSQGGSMPNVGPDDIIVKISFRLTIGDLIDSNIMQLLTVSFAKDLVGSLLGGSTGEESPPSSVPAQEPPAQRMAEPAPQPPAAASQAAAPQVPRPEEGYPPAYEQPGPQAPYHEPPMQPPAAAARPQHLGQGAANRNVNVQPVQFSDLSYSGHGLQEPSNLDILLDIPLKVTVELGRTEKVIKDILELSQGSIIELDKLAGEPVDILVNNKLIAKGEVVVIDENFGVRVTDIISQWDRMQKIR